jgi:hypothetical protein|tara:strand:+ start:149 stop:331 length:183 start_codon:yes stop_codon:yes gene_type:complete
MKLRTTKIIERTHYEVELWENGVLLETRSCTNHSRAYAESIEENFINGVINPEQLQLQFD